MSEPETRQPPERTWLWLDQMGRWRALGQPSEHTVEYVRADLLQQPAASEHCVECGHVGNINQDGICMAFNSSLVNSGVWNARCEHRCVVANSPAGDLISRERVILMAEDMATHGYTASDVADRVRYMTAECVFATTGPTGELITRQDAMRAMCYMCAKPERYGPPEPLLGSQRLFHFQLIDNWNAGQCLAQPILNISVATTIRDAGAGRQLIQDLATFSFDVLMDDAAPRLAIMGSVSALRHMQARAQELLVQPADAAEGEPRRCAKCNAELRRVVFADTQQWRLVCPNMDKRNIEGHTMTNVFDAPAAEPVEEGVQDESWKRPGDNLCGPHVAAAIDVFAIRDALPRLTGKYAWCDKHLDQIQDRIKWNVPHDVCAACWIEAIVRHCSTIPAANQEVERLKTERLQIQRALAATVLEDPSEDDEPPYTTIEIVHGITSLDQRRRAAVKRAAEARANAIAECVRGVKSLFRKEGDPADHRDYNNGVEDAWQALESLIQQQAGGRERG